MLSIPPISSSCTALAPVSARERKIRSGSSGRAAVASRATNAASSATESAASHGERASTIV